jgi:hypothetical protein
MTSPIFNEQFYTGAFLVSEGPGLISRDIGFIDNATGGDVLYEGGLVIVQAAAGIVASSHPANTGNGTIGSLSTLAGSIFGVYVLTATDATHFNVVDPNGNLVGVAVAGVAFANEVGFTITAGGTAFVAGDIFDLTVSEQTGGWVSWTGGAISTPIAVLYDRKWVLAGTAAKVTIMRRHCEVNASELQWDAAVTGAGNAAVLQATAIAALLLAGIVAR